MYYYYYDYKILFCRLLRVQKMIEEPLCISFLVFYQFLLHLLLSFFISLSLSSSSSQDPWERLNKTLPTFWTLDMPITARIKSFLPFGCFGERIYWTVANSFSKCSSSFLQAIYLNHIKYKHSVWYLSFGEKGGMENERKGDSGRKGMKKIYGKMSFVRS